MQLKIVKPNKSINKAYYKQSIGRSNIDELKSGLKKLFERIDDKESEEHLKNLLSDFLKESLYKGLYEINTKERIDLAIHNGKSSKDSVGVIVEVKRPQSPERLTPDNFNCKALHELILYYFEERNENKNLEVKHLITTNIFDWFVFDENEFDKIFYRNTKLQKLYKVKVEQSKDNPFFYTEAQKIIAELDDEMNCTYINLKDYERVTVNNDDTDDAQLIDLYKILSPEHLLKLQFANDSNSLNKEFYNELLHIIGLEETKEGSKKIITRKKPENRADGSLLENAINIIRTDGCLDNISNLDQYGDTQEERIFSIGLELCINWLNRILFLKLLEGQLISYHRGKKDFAFLNSTNIRDFDEMEELFFEVLAVKTEDRTKSVNQKFGHVPYLNSSLFERSELENKTIRINSLKDRLTLPVYKSTVIKDKDGKRITGDKSTLAYLFDFLEAYDFASEGSARIQEQNKSIINASVLGLIFEKINGYKDGSFFTPGFITMYMCRETLRRAVVQKFNESLTPTLSKGEGEKYNDLTDIYNNIGKDFTIAQANQIINNLKICDPAVGSGHFLVSALNEILTIKSELGILSDNSGKLLRDWKVSVENDELIIIDSDSKIFEYTAPLSNGRGVGGEAQRMQETIFHEKQTIIENCLFGVDINPKSVMICRLRLWVELLKNAYYTKESNYAELETLPNIDINIKCGNSLISRFALDADLSKALKSIKYDIKAYRGFVNDYKNAHDKQLKRGLEQIINNIKTDFRSEINNNDPKVLRLNKLGGELYSLLHQQQMFEPTLKEKASKKLQQEKLEADINKLTAEIEGIKSSAIYRNAFEWRFEFPEILDEKGDFVGFDVVIGNPPYIPLEGLLDAHKLFFKSKYDQIERKYDTSILFIIDGLNIANKNGLLAYIAPITWQTGENYYKLRQHVFENKGVFKIINLPFNIFEDAYVETAIYLLNNRKTDGYFIYNFDKKASGEKLFELPFSYISNDVVDKESYKIVLNIEANKFLQKFKSNKFIPLGNISKSTQGLSGSAFLPTIERGINTYPFLKKGNVYNYQLAIEESYFIDISEHQSLKQFYEAEPKVLIRRIINRQDRLSVGYTEDKMVFKKDINPFIPTSDYSAKFLLGILASRLISFLYLRISTIATKDDFRQTTLSELRNLPVPKLSLKEQQHIIKIVSSILSKKQSKPQADTIALENQIDQLVYQLYGLSEDEIKIVEGGV